MYGHAAGPSRVYRYGLLPPVEGAERVDEQIRAAHRYRNLLVEIERRRRESARAFLASHPDADLQAAREAEAQALAAWQTVRDAIARGHQEGRTRRTPREHADALRAARQSLREARQRTREARRRLLTDPSVRESLATIDRAAHEECIRARAECGLYWGTYLAVEQGVERARRGRMDPRFRPFDGSGRLAVQLQGGLPVAEVYGDDSRLRIDPTPLPVPGRGGKPRPRLYLRVGSDGGRPVWAVFPIILHRPLPPDGRVKWAYVVRERVGTHYRYCAQFVVEFPAEPSFETGPGDAAIDVGWRMVDGRLRVAYAWDGERGEELALDARWLEGMARVERIRAHRDELFNTARAAFIEAHDDSWPEWLHKATETVAQWRSPGRLAGIVLQWRENRFPGDEAIYERLESWRKRDKHLYEYEANLRDHLLAARKDLYRRWVAELRRRCRTVYLEDFDLRQVAREDATREPAPPNAQHQRHWAAVSVLRQTLGQSGMAVVRVPGAYSTLTCSWCGTLDPFDAAQVLEHTCSGCGRRWDQDENAARNLLAWGRAARHEDRAAG